MRPRTKVSPALQQTCGCLDLMLPDQRQSKQAFVCHCCATDMATDERDFPPLHIIEPVAGKSHTHTAIMIHGRGSTGPEFADELSSTPLSGEQRSSRFPSWRWVFPSSQPIWNSVFEEEFPAWFEAHSLTDIDARQDLQMEGITLSTQYLVVLVNEEVDRLRGACENLFICGISQGGAIGLWTLLCQASPERRIGGFVGASCWLPFAEAIRQLFRNEDKTSYESSKSLQVTQEARGFVSSLMSNTMATLVHKDAARSWLDTPVLVGHGMDDAYVDPARGRQVEQVLEHLGFKVQWKEYSGAAQEGHWFKEPEQLDDITDFLAAAAKPPTEPAGISS
jgi:lysophospholipase II